MLESPGTSKFVVIQDPKPEVIVQQYKSGFIITDILPGNMYLFEFINEDRVRDATVVYIPLDINHPGPPQLPRVSELEKNLNQLASDGWSVDGVHTTSRCKLVVFSR
jgi:hypothetical protein